jgi:hypothetical protein
MTATRSLLDFDAQVDLAQGVGRTFEWYRRHVFAGGGLSAR